MDRDEQLGYLCALGAVFIWSGFILVSRMGGISDLLAYDVIAIRYATCAALLLPVWWFWKRVKLFQPRLIASSFIGGLGYALFAFEGFEHTPGSHAAVLLPGLLPIAITLISTVLDKQRFPFTKWLGVGVITLGILALFLQELSPKQSVSLNHSLSGGHLLLVGAAVCWGIFSVLVARWKISPWEATFSLAIVTCAVYLPIYVLFLPKNIMSVALSEIAIQAIYQGFLATIVQMILYVRAVELIGAQNMGAMMAIVPILAGLSAIPIFGESPSIALVVAFLCVSSGVFIANSTKLQTLSITKMAG